MSQVSVTFMVGYAVFPRANQDKWIDLGIQTGACMTRPEKCGATGGAISLWIKVHLEDVTSLTTGVITSMDEVSSGEISTGFQIRCKKYGCV